MRVSGTSKYWYDIHHDTTPALLSLFLLFFIRMEVNALLWKDSKTICYPHKLEALYSKFVVSRQQEEYCHTQILNPNFVRGTGHFYIRDNIYEWFWYLEKFYYYVVQHILVKCEILQEEVLKVLRWEFTSVWHHLVLSYQYVIIVNRFILFPHIISP